MKKRSRIVLGILGIAVFAVHAGCHVAIGRPADFLWMCHLGALAVVCGLPGRRPGLIGIGFLWLSVGDLLWVLDMLRAGELMPTSLGTHVGGLTLGAIGLRRLGLPRACWWETTAWFVPVWILSRLVTPPAENVNLVFSIHDGWEAYFHFRWIHTLSVLALGTCIVFGVEWTLRRTGSREPLFSAA